MSQCANIGPADYNYDETISTLRYANRAKNIKNKARINEDPKDALLRQFQKEIEELKKKLEEGEIPLPPGVCIDKCLSYLSLYLISLSENVTQVQLLFAGQCFGFDYPVQFQKRCPQVRAEGPPGEGTWLCPLGGTCH